MIFEQIISMLGEQAVFAVYLPFLLLFSIFYALLTKTGIFGKSSGEGSTRVNVTIAFIMALYVAAYSPASGAIAMWFASLFSTLGVSLVSILAVLLIVVMILSPWWDKLAEDDVFKGAWKSFAVLAIVIGFLVLLGSIYGISVPGGQVQIPGLTSQDITFLILVIITLLILWYITSGWGGRLPSKAVVPFKFE
jgi:hypothetical protein